MNGRLLIAIFLVVALLVSSAFGWWIVNLFGLGNIMAFALAVFIFAAWAFGPEIAKYNRFKNT